MENNTALIIIDIQNDYFPGGANPLVNSTEAVLQAKKVLDQFRLLNFPVVHVKHVSNRAGATFFLPGTAGVEIHSLLKPLEGEQIIEKNVPNSFRDTPLLSYLQRNNIANLVVCGMMTHMCVDATVRAAKDYGYNCTILSDACATKDLEFSGHKVSAIDVQASFLAALSYFYANIMNTNTYLKQTTN